MRMVTYDTMHSRLGHVYRGALKKTFGLHPPTNFDCLTCTLINRKNFLQKLSEFTVRERNELQKWEHLQIDVMYGSKDRRLRVDTYLVLINVKTRFSIITPLKELCSITATLKLRELMIQRQARLKHITTKGDGFFVRVKFKPTEKIL